MELTGHTAHNRLGAVARRPAPVQARGRGGGRPLVHQACRTAVSLFCRQASTPTCCPLQVTWIGYPNSTGLTRVDYRFTDAICDPKDTAQTYTEALVRLPTCFLCYTPTPEAPPVMPPPALASGFVTFGSFNALAKQTPEVGDWGQCTFLGLPAPLPAAPMLAA